jgi:ATP-binding protein involved in chromosome partitioning
MLQTPPPLRLAGVSHVLAVASGKGGVGKTTVAVHLALALRREGARVGLFDADLYGPNVPLLLGLRRRHSAGVMFPAARVDTTPYLPPIERFGLKVMSIGFVLSDTDTVKLDPLFIGRLLHQTLKDIVWGELDFLLLDFPPGTGEPQRTFLRTVQIDGALIVTTPQDLSLMDTTRSLHVFQEAGVPILGVIENMSALHCPHCGEPIEVFARSTQTWTIAQPHLPVLGRIPLYRAFSESIDEAHPLLQTTTDSPEAQVFRQIAATVSKMFTEGSTA